MGTCDGKFTYTYLEFAGHIVGGVYHEPGDEHVETGDDGERDGVVDEEFDEDHGFGVGGSQVVWVRVARLEQRDVVHAELTDVRVPGGGDGARCGHGPYGHGYSHREPGGEPAADGLVDLAHRIDDCEVPVGAERGQREHRHADRNVLGRLRHFASGQSIGPRRKLHAVVDRKHGKKIHFNTTRCFFIKNLCCLPTFNVFTGVGRLRIAFVTQLPFYRPFARRYC